MALASLPHLFTATRTEPFIEETQSTGADTHFVVKIHGFSEYRHTDLSHPLLPAIVPLARQVGSKRARQDTFPLNRIFDGLHIFVLERAHCFVISLSFATLLLSFDVEFSVVFIVAIATCGTLLLLRKVLLTMGMGMNIGMRWGTERRVRLNVPRDESETEDDDAIERDN